MDRQNEFPGAEASVVSRTLIVANRLPVTVRVRGQRPQLALRATPLRT